MDTSKDYRILVAEKAACDLENIVKYRRINLPLNWSKLLELIREIKSLILKIKYSFLPRKMLIQSSELKKIMDIVTEISKEIFRKDLMTKFKPDPYVIACTRYALRTLYGLRYRLGLGEENKPWYAIDIEGVEVVSVHKHPNADKLFITRAEGIFSYTIVTNIQDIKKGEVRAAAILPPAIIRGQLSEAMYCSGPLPKEYKKKRPPEDLIDTKEITNIIYKIVGSR